MDKRYQVFVSSTYRDLIKYRRLVITALMQINAIPAGMELFPAADDTAWTIIKRAIDESDYYLVIVGGRYGSVDTDGIGFTEKEYDYAVTQNKPVMGFLHREPDKLERGMTDTDQQTWAKLQAFRAKVEKRHCKYWKTKGGLVQVVLSSYHHLIYTCPAPGWVRGDQAKTIEDVEKLAGLQQRVAELEAENARLRTQAGDDTSLFAQGDDEVTLTLLYKKPGEQQQTGFRLRMTWNELFRICGSVMLNGRSPGDVYAAVSNACWERALNKKVIAHQDVDLRTGRACSLTQPDWDMIRDQFLALGLMNLEFDEDSTVCWRLTPRGQAHLVRQRAVRRD